MKQDQKNQNYLRLEAQIQCCNKRMARSKDQGCLFTDSVSHTAAADYVRLLQHLHCKTLIISIWCFLFNQYHFPKSTFTQNSNGVKTVYRNFGSAVLPLVSVWPETQSFNVLLRHWIIYTIYRCCNYNTIIRCFCCSCWCWLWWWQRQR